MEQNDISYGLNDTGSSNFSLGTGIVNFLSSGVVQGISGYIQGQSAAKLAEQSGQLQAQFYEMAATSAIDLGEYNKKIITLNEQRGAADLFKENYYQSGKMFTGAASSNIGLASGSFISALMASKTAFNLKNTQLAQTANIQRDKAGYDAQVAATGFKNQAISSRYSAQVAAANAKYQATQSLLGGIGSGLNSLAKTFGGF